jgi:hypothetical protein
MKIFSYIFPDFTYKSTFYRDIIMSSIVVIGTSITSLSMLLKYLALYFTDALAEILFPYFVAAAFALFRILSFETAK